MLKCGAVSARNFNECKFNRLYLFEERDCFISGEQDVGCVKDLQMNNMHLPQRIINKNIRKSRRKSIMVLGTHNYSLLIKIFAR